MGCEPAADLGVLCVEELSKREMDSEVCGGFAVDPCEETS
jgi:hypothetical protein